MSPTPRTKRVSTRLPSAMSQSSSRAIDLVAELAQQRGRRLDAAQLLGVSAQPERRTPIETATRRRPGSPRAASA